MTCLYHDDDDDDDGDDGDDDDDEDDDVLSHITGITSPNPACGQKTGRA